jgi:hypothetical protein
MRPMRSRSRRVRPAPLFLRGQRPARADGEQAEPDEDRQGQGGRGEEGTEQGPLPRPPSGLQAGRRPHQRPEERSVDEAGEGGDHEGVGRQEIAPVGYGLDEPFQEGRPEAADEAADGQPDGRPRQGAVEEVEGRAAEHGPGQADAQPPLVDRHGRGSLTPDRFCHGPWRA